MPRLPLSSQALELYRRVRLQTLAASKAALLASVPCTTSALAQYSFDVDQYPEVGGPGMSNGSSKWQCACFVAAAQPGRNWCCNQSGTYRV